jgi:oxygen-independent coproporphyrinogen-3 oxidase
MLGLYIHVPFCSKKCPYCDFYSVKYTKLGVLEFVENIKNEIKTYPQEEIDTIYFGGGTPSILPIEYLEQIVFSINEYFLLKIEEMTIEVNPNTVNLDKLLKYKKLGFNRLSVGVQSLNDNELKFLGRQHSADKALECIKNAKIAGFDNISADIMLGIPRQTEEILSETIKKLEDVQHISAYILKIEEKTPFYGNVEVDEDLSADLYLFTVKKLEEMGFLQYEISNFSKKGFESKHNLKYWKCEEYIGLGKSAHSFYNGKRYFDRYIITENNPGTYEEKTMLSLRLCGWTVVKNIKKAAEYEKSGYLDINENMVKLMPKGFLISNKIINDLL